MVKEFQRRPFCRPLLFWITGILLQTTFQFHTLAVGLVLVPAGIVLASFIHYKKAAFPAYHARWVWGVSFACILLFLSVQMTAWQQRKADRSPEKTSPELYAAQVREKIIDHIDRLELREERKAILAAVVLGYKKNMDRNIRQQFNTTGVAHIMAVSGFHVAVVAGFISCLLFFISSSHPAGRWLKYILTLGLVWTYAFLTGLAPSAVRAATMFSFYLTGRLIRKPADNYNTLAAAAFCMLIYNPFYLVDIGFQLSYLAVFFILFLQSRIHKLLEVRNPLLSVPWGWITVTLSAQIGVTFLCLYYFGRFSTVFLLTNLPLTLLASLLIPFTIIWIIYPAGIPGSDLLQRVVEFLTNSMATCVESFSLVPGASFAFAFGGVSLILCYLSLFILLLYIRTKTPAYLITSLSIFLIFLLYSLAERM